MALYKSAQLAYSDDSNQNKDEVILYEDAPPADVVEVHGPSIKPHMMIEEEFVVPELPGSELPLEVMENEHAAEEAKAKEDENKAEEGKPRDLDDLLSWDGDVKGWAEHKMSRVPKHRGEFLGLTRARAFMNNAIAQMDRAVSNDLEGKIDIAELEKIRMQMEAAIDRLEQAAKLKRRKKADDEQDEIVKTAFTPKFQGWIVAVPGYISRIARGLISSTVSGGHDIGIQFQEQVKKYSLDLKDQASLLQVLEDSGYPLRQDKLLAPNDEIEVSNEGQSREYNVNYYA